MTVSADERDVTVTGNFTPRENVVVTGMCYPNHDGQQAGDMEVVQEKEFPSDADSFEFRLRAGHSTGSDGKKKPRVANGAYCDFWSTTKRPEETPTPTPEPTPEANELPSCNGAVEEKVRARGKGDYKTVVAHCVAPSLTATITDFAVTENGSKGKDTAAVSGTMTAGENTPTENLYAQCFPTHKNGDVGHQIKLNITPDPDPEMEPEPGRNAYQFQTADDEPLKTRLKSQKINGVACYFGTSAPEPDPSP